MTATARPLCFSLLFLLACALVLVASGCRPCASASGPKQTYHCPMHPSYNSDRPGDCPICNMKLVPVKEHAAGASPAAGSASAGAHVQPGQFYCPMCPEVVTNAPGTCWECNMRLVEKTASSPTAPPPGRVAVMVTPEKQHRIGLKTAVVEERDLTRTIRATAVVQHDETRYARVAPRFGGWVKSLHVNFTGQAVAPGDPLLTIYSPEVLATEQEYLLARRQVERSKTNAAPAELAAAQRLLASARKRLELWEIGETEIYALEQRVEPTPEVLLRAPVAGHVITKNAVAGRAFMAGETLYELADLDHVWLRVSLLESDFVHVAVGQKARVTLPQLGNQAIEGSISFLYPHLDPQTRRAEARIELENPGRRLRPDMWANVDLELALGHVLAVPASAVIDTGTRCVAFVHGAEDHLVPREVKVGWKTDDYWQVLAGLSAGDKVVTRALFLIDAESQLKAAIAGLADRE